MLLAALGSVRTGKNCDLGLENAALGLRPAAAFSSHSHSFSLYGPPSRPVTHIYGINKVLLLLNEHGDPSFLFPNLSSYNINNQLAKFEKILSVGSISME